MRTLRLAAALLAMILWIPTFFGVSYGGMLWGALRGLTGEGGETAAVSEPASAAAPESAAPAAPTEPPPPPPPPRDAALLDTARLGPERIVTVIETVPFEALLAPRESPPDPLYRDLYAEARAGAVASAECARLLAALAAACLPLGVVAEPLPDGRYRITARLAFAPLDPIRALAEDEAFERSETAVTLDDDAARGIAPEALGATREVYYRAARAACVWERISGAACTVAEVRIESRDSVLTPGTFDLSATARLATSRPAQGG